jgi:DNA-binding XRE family transcriptional regulator
MKSKKPRHSKVAEFFRENFPKDYPKAEEFIANELVNLDIAQKIYDLRERAKLTQAQLAKLIGTTPSVISRLEDADYHGHSLTMLGRIAYALNKRIEIHFVNKPKRRRPA